MICIYDITQLKEKNMKLLSVYLLFLVLSVGIFSMNRQKKTRVIFFGDSITQVGMNPGGFIVRMNDELWQKGLHLNMI